MTIATLPSRVTIVGAIEESGRFPGRMSLRAPCTKPYMFGTPGFEDFGQRVPPRLGGRTRRRAPEWGTNESILPPPKAQLKNSLYLVAAVAAAFALAACSPNGVGGDSAGVLAKPQVQGAAQGTTTRYSGARGLVPSAYQPSLTPTTLLPNTNPFAGSYEVRGRHRSYYFPDGSLLTRGRGLLMVRAYGTIWVYSAGSVTVRRMTTRNALALSALPLERNATMLRSFISREREGRRTLVNDPCPDCVVPLQPGFLSGQSFGRQPQPQFKVTPSNITGCDPEATCVEATSVPDGAVAKPDGIGGLAKAYVWLYWCSETKMVAQLPPWYRHHREIWVSYYQDYMGFTGKNSGIERANSHAQLGWTASPSYTYLSTMTVAIADSNSERFLGDALGITAVPYYGSSCN